MPRSLQEMPGPPKSHWLLGHQPQFQSDPLGFYEHCRREYGDVVLTWIWHLPCVQLSHPAHIQQAFVQHNDALSKSIDFKLLRIAVGDGILSSEGAAWKRNRKLIQPLFSHDRIMGYGEAVVRQADAHLDRWGPGLEIDVSREMWAIALTVINEVLMGVHLPEEADVVGSALDSFMDEFERLWTSAIPFPTLASLRALGALRRLDRLVYRLIRERREAPEEQDDLLGRLLRASDEEGRLTDRQIRDEVVTLLLAGHETTALSLSWALMRLAQSPEVARNLSTELSAVLGDRLPTPDDLPRLSYTRAVIDESMRLYPPAWAIGRATIREVEIAGYRLPKGVQLFMLPWVTHRDERFFPDPLAFRPERFLEDLPERRAWFPFGAGPRKCIGARFATMEATLALATIARRFSLELVPNHPIELQPAVTLRPRHGIRAIVRPAVSTIQKETLREREPGIP